MAEYQKGKEEVMQRMDFLEKEIKEQDYDSLIFPVPPEEYRIDDDFIYTAELLDEKTLNSLSLQKEIRLNKHRIIWSKTITIKNYQSSHRKILHDAKKIQNDVKRFDFLMQKR